MKYRNATNQIKCSQCLQIYTNKHVLAVMFSELQLNLIYFLETNKIVKLGPPSSNISYIISEMTTSCQLIMS